MVKALKIFLFILAFVIIGEIAYFTVFKPKTKPGQTTSTSNGTQNDTNKILYQEKGDSEERTLFYENKSLPYPGIGEIYNTATSPAKLLQVIGSFQGWESIQGTKDRYLILENPINKKGLRKVRVAFEPSSLFGINPTALAVENLNTGKALSLYKQIKDLPNETINFLIQKNDAVVALTFFDKDDKNILDNNGVVCVNWLVLRRKEGTKTLDF